ncbi:glycosyltransferase family 25 protein [soil metagenome]
MTNHPTIQAYVINLEGAIKRWTHIQKMFAEAGMIFERVPAIDGKSIKLEPAQYSESWYRFLHGRVTNPSELGCYLSHLQAMHRFLETDSEFALICEDDITFGPELATVLAAVLARPRFWNILRLSGLSDGHPLRVEPVYGDFFFCISLGRIKGAGAYLIDRKAARVFTTRLLPMKLPYDHALDREWFYQLKAAAILPFPVNQKQKRFGSSIQTYAQPKLSRFRRWLTTYPYQAGNELMRWLFRGASYLAVRLSRDMGEPPAAHST